MRLRVRRMSFIVTVVTMLSSFGLTMSAGAQTAPSITSPPPPPGVVGTAYLHLFQSSAQTPAAVSS